MITTTDRISEELMRRIKGEFLEMPGLHVTEPQARRLWQLDQPQCAALLTALVDEQFLSRTDAGVFMRIKA